MLTGEIRSQIDRIWDSFWSGGISNPLEVIEQITYLLFKPLFQRSTCNHSCDLVDGNSIPECNTAGVPFREF